MFLIEGPRGAVLHTGDVRAEQWWCESLIRNALLQRYIAWDREVLSSKYTFDHGYEWSDVMVDHGQNDGPPQRLPRSDAVQSPDKESPFSESLGQEGKDQSLRLKNIYLDTESLFSNRPALSKVSIGSQAFTSSC